jgi:Putative Ig domain
LGKVLKTIATSAGFFSLLFYCLGCGSNLTQQITSPQAAAIPSITQVLPQTILAGSQTMTLKVTGTNFPTQAAILWNGASLTTTMVDANTLSGTIGSSSLANPGTAQLQVQNTQTMQLSPSVPVTIAPASSGSSNPLAISTTPLPQGVVSAPYTGTLSVSGGTSPYTWSITAGQLPPGLNLAANTGVITGTPTANGNYSFDVTVADSSPAAQTATATIALSVAAAPATPTPLTINSSSLPAAIIGSAYSNVLQATGGTAPYTWSIASGSLPASLSLAPATGLISGTPTAVGTATFTAAVVDSAKPAQTTSVSVSIVVAPVSLTITSSALPSGTQGTGYSRALQASGGTGSYTWSITTGSLPAGLSLAPTTGIISGTPTVSGNNLSFGVTVKDSGSPAQTATAPETISVVAAGSPLAISSTTLPGGTPNQSYLATLNATGGTAPYTWSITKGTLPAGLSLSATTGLISGTPTAVGTANFTATVTDVGNPVQTQSVPFSIVVAVVPLTVTTSALPSGTKGTSYSNLLQASGGTAPYSWSITTGSLPAGLSLAASTGLITGTPTATGTTTFTATVTDAGNPALTKSVSLSIVVAVVPLTVTTSSLPSGIKGTAYSNALQASGGTAPYSWSITTGSLPAGLSLAASTGLITGTPTATGTTTFTATVTDSGNPALTKSVSLSFVVVVPALSITTSSLPSGTQGTSYSNAITATGGTTPYTWSIKSGSLPAGLSLAPSTGLISGTPTASGNFSITVSVKDSSSAVQTASAPLALSVSASSTPLAITSTTLAGATLNQTYSASLGATGGTTPYMWSISSGSLPAGLSLTSGTGLISGTPTASGSVSFTAMVTDAESPSQSKSVTISLSVIPGALTITSTLPAGTNGSAYSAALQVSGGTPAYTWSIPSGSLPAGLTMSATTGVISGTPSANGTSNFTVAVSDNSNPVQTKSATTSIVVGAVQAAGSGTTWHIRLDGGTNTQCTGTTNAAYPGSGTLQPCAYNHPYQMLNYSGAWTSFTAGDTMEFDDPPTNTTPYYMGEQNGGLGSDWSAQIAGICPPPNSPASAGSSCTLPVPPSGVTIKGQNYGNCHTAGHTGLVNPTVLSGINGVFTVLDVQGTNNVTISCIEITQPDTCTTSGSGYGGGQCTNTSNYVNAAGLMMEYQTNQGPANLTLTDFAVIGTSSNGILGGRMNVLTTDTFTASDIYIIGNGSAGWNSDGGGCNTSCESIGTMNVSYADIEWNGCMAVKPYNVGITPEANTNGFNYCYGQNTSGYGDGFVLIASNDLTLNVSYSKFKYNTQDGFDAAHLSDDITHHPAVNITSSWSEGNAGQTFKIGAGAASTAINNVSISNCHVLSQSATFPNNPSGWVTLDGGDTCRAAGDQWALALNNNTVVTLENNTSVGYGTTMFDVACSYGNTSCGSNGATVIYKNNIAIGYPDPGNSARLASGFYFESGISPSNATADHNLWFTMHTGCPDNTLTGETNYVCSDPLLVGESNIDAINPSLTTSSPAIGAGVSISGITTDHNGVTRPNPPSIGALEP